MCDENVRSVLLVYLISGRFSWLGFEFRGALLQPFLNGRMDGGVKFLVASGYPGLTTLNFFPANVQELAGVRMPFGAS